MMAKQSIGSNIVSVLMLCFALFSPVFGQVESELKEFSQAQAEFDNGGYVKAIEIAETGIGKARIRKNTPLVFKGLDIIASSQISLENYDKAELTLNEALQLASNPEEKARVYFRFAWHLRSQRKFAESVEFSKKALLTAPQNRQIQTEYFLNIGRVLFTSGYDISAIVWLEKAEQLLDPAVTNAVGLDVYRFLTLAWSSKLHFHAALKYAEKWASVSRNTQFKYKHRQSLFELATILSASGQTGRANYTLETGVTLAVEQNSSYHACIFLSSLLLHSLDDENITKARTYLNSLEKLDVKKAFSFEILLGKAIVYAFNGQQDQAGQLFADLDRMESSSEFVLLYWKIAMAEKNHDWKRMIALNQELLDLNTRNNFRDGLPRIYLNFANANFQLGRRQASIEYLEKSLGYIEEIRRSQHTSLSLGFLDTFHDAYRLLVQIKSETSGTPQEAFQLADFLKARLLRDKINNAAIKTESIVPSMVRQKLEELSLRYLNDPSVAGEIEQNEKLTTTATPELSLDMPDLTALDKIPGLANTAVVSYLFTLDKRLSAFVWEKDRPVRMVHLPVSEKDIEAATKSTQQKIKNFIFFKRDGRELFDKLLKPLSLSAKHLVIVPDKHLWKIPFQALSPDGEKYLIEDKIVSYAPSVSILLEQLKAPIPVRRTLHAFANPSYNKQFLKYVNAEATGVAGLYNSRPVLNATVADFRRFSDTADILHLSMHAQVDNDQPLDSFLGFKGTGKESGRLTVEDLLNTKLKKGSLVFLASCDTNNVLSGEGLVSLAWAMMGSGATTVISAQWEANDKLTGLFTKKFYGYYKRGFSSAEALQKASQELIKDKSNSMHEPYYWADFTVNGDFR